MTTKNFLKSKESYLNIKHSGKLKNNFINKIV